MASLTLDHVYKEYVPGTPVVSDMCLEVEDGEFVVFVGPSGCGKSTALRMVSGLEEPTNGSILIGGRAVEHMQPKDRDIAMVFQSYALYPHMSVYDNCAFGLKLRREPRPEIDRRVRAAARTLDLEALLERKPGQLSGGQRQRVALARAIVRDPAIFLMDEPLSNLDAKLRVQTRVQIMRLHERLRATFIYVTHDQVEAMTMGDRIVVMKDGVIQQAADAQTVYDRPANTFVAGFIGSPAMNLFTGLVVGDGDVHLQCGDFSIPLDGVDAARRLQTGETVTVGVRPEHFRDARDVNGDAGGRLQAKVDVVETLGRELHLHVRCGQTPFTVSLDPRRPFAPGEQIALAVDPRDVHLFDNETNATLRSA
jgi:multiple sugar transport system ATP-binding protein